MYEIIIEDHFTAIHYLKLYDGSWEKPHGHNWKVAVTAQAENLDSIGVVMDFEMLKPALKEILAGFNCTSFNEHPRFKGTGVNSSTENIARLIYDELVKKVKSKTARITKITVWETADACASFIENAP